MSISEAQLIEAFKTADARISRLEDNLRQVRDDAQPIAKNSTADLRVAVNLLVIRDMFLMEILRQKGMLEGIDLNAIEAAVKERHAGERPGWGASENAALKNLKQVLQEIAGDYNTSW